MIKKTTVFFLFILCINSFAENQVPLITEIALIKTNTYDQLHCPRKLIIGIEISADAYYKLSFKGEIIKAGILHQGLNLIHLEASHFFKTTAVHSYILGLKKEDLVLEKNIIIDIRLETSTILKTEAQNRNMEYKLSLFVGDKLIASRKKTLHDALLPKIETPPSSKYYEPFDPNFRTTPGANSFSILGAVAGILKLIKELKSNKEKPEETIHKQHQMTITFQKVDSEGTLKEVRATITLSTGDK